MTNNDVMKSVRYTLDLKNAEVVKVIKEGGVELNALDVSRFHKDATEEGYVDCPNETIHAFLDGLILKRRGPSDLPIDKEATKWINNNVVLRKLRIAFEMKDTDMIATMKSAGFTVSKGEINALFRATTHKNYKKCQDQFLRYFLKGLTLKFRPPENPWDNCKVDPTIEK